MLQCDERACGWRLSVNSNESVCGRQTDMIGNQKS